MFDSFWSDFKWKIFSFCFLPYLAYFSIAFIYLTMMLFESDEFAEEYGFDSDNLSYIETYEPPIRYIFLVFLLFHTGVQIRQMINDGLAHHLDQT